MQPGFPTLLIIKSAANIRIYSEKRYTNQSYLSLFDYFSRKNIKKEKAALPVPLLFLSTAGLKCECINSSHGGTEPPM